MKVATEESTGKIECSAAIIVKNEAQSLFKLLPMLHEFKEVIVVDSYSADSTARVAKSWGAKVCERTFDNFANQKNFAVEQASCDWIFSIDADEIPDQALLNSLKTVIDQEPSVAAYRIKRKNIHFGRELKWAGQGSDFPLRIFRKGKGQFVGPVHETVQIEGRVEKLKGSLLHVSNEGVGDYLDKLVLYARLEAQTAQQKRNQTTFWHWGAKPVLRFMYVYFIRLGFLDGFEGFLFHSLSSFYLVAKEGMIEQDSKKS